MHSILGNQAADFFNALDSRSAISFRLNPAKTNASPVDPVRWWPKAGYLPERPLFIADPIRHAGAYYVQEASSTIIGHILDRLDLGNAPQLLDLCAAPGGKSTLLLDALPEEAILLSNEVIAGRAAVLAEILCRYGRINSVVSRNDASEIGSSGFWPVSGRR